MRERQRKAYDAKCYGLAEHYLDDYDLSREDRASIAHSIAACVEIHVQKLLKSMLGHLPRRATKAERNAKCEAFPR